MALYFTFDLPILARQSLYLDALSESRTIGEVVAFIERFHDGIPTRPRRPIPH